jgi:predicted dehydrogenase
MERLRVAVVGVGVMGTMHARAYAQCDSADLVGVMDLDATRVQEVSTALGVQGTTRLDELVEDPSIEAITVALPDREHVATTCRLLEAGKHVLLEKPMAHTLEAARQIAAAEEQSDARLMIAHLLRFDPRYEQAAVAVAGGRIGEAVHTYARRLCHRSVGVRLRGATTPVHFLATHDVDAIQWITGSRITRVYSRSVSKAVPGPDRSQLEVVVATLELENGCVGTLEAGWALPDGIPARMDARLEVVGTQGAVQVDVRDHGLHIIEAGAVSFPDTLHYPDVNGRLGGDVLDEVRHFVTAVRDQGPFVISTAEAMSVTAVNDAITRSLDSGKSEAVDLI